VGPDDAGDHRSATCGSAGRRHRRSAGTSCRRKRIWSASDHPQSPIPLPTSNPPAISTDVLVMVSGGGQVNFSPFSDVVDLLGATES